MDGQTCVSDPFRHPWKDMSKANQSKTRKQKYPKPNRKKKTMNTRINNDNSFYISPRMSKNILPGHEDRQWDARINVQTDEYLEDVVQAIKDEDSKGKFKYILIGGLEVGTKPTQDDYQVRHVHIAAIFHNRASKSSILTNWHIKQGNGYYLVPRNRDLPYQGWRAHHIKEFSKVDQTALSIYESGELPADVGQKRKITERSDLEKKSTTDEVLRKIRKLLEDGRDEDAFQQYPRNFVLYGERLKAMITQRKPEAVRVHPHIWLYGFPGTGKTAVMNYVYPRMYKKDLNNRFFDLFDMKVHTHIMLEDMDHANIEKLGIQFLKTLCDESGFPIDQKYKTPQIAKATILVTSNFCLDAVIPEGKGVTETKMAMARRFMHVRIDDMMKLLGLKLIPKYERNQLKLKGNTNPAAVFMAWNYLHDCPTGEEVKEPEYYQERILAAYYA